MTGIWHGANWTFLLWGLYHGTFLMAEEFIPKSSKKSSLRTFLSHIYLILVVLIGFVLFRCDSLTDFGLMMKSMFTSFNGTAANDMLFASLLNPLNVTALIAGVVFSMPVSGKLTRLKFMKGLSYPAALVAVVIAILCLSSGSYNPFIYFRF